MLLLLKCYNSTFWISFSKVLPASNSKTELYQRNTYVLKKTKSFTKSSFVTLLLVSQNALYDTKVKIVIYLTSSCVNWAFCWYEWARLKRE
jgi:hypothetical protein